MFNCVHYCLLCNKTEKCKQEFCDFRNLLLCHGFCYAILDKDMKIEYDKIIHVLKQFQKMEILKN